MRKAINENLPDGYEEGMQCGMIGWYVPLSVYPAGYDENPKVPGFPNRVAGIPKLTRKALTAPAVKFAPCEPLPFVALASQKSGMVLHFL